MLCQFCQVNFPFYLKYCRQCGNRLLKVAGVKVNTSQMVSSIKRADIGNIKMKYCTSPMTQQMGKPINSVAEVLQNIMNEFPSLDTVKMSEVFPALCLYQHQHQHQLKMSKTEQMRQTLREFDMSELQELENNSSILAILDANTYKIETKKAAITTVQTIEFKRPSAYLGETLPFSSSSSTNTTMNVNKTKLVLGSDRLSSSRSLPTRLYLPNSGSLVKISNKDLSNNSIAITFRQTINNLWIRMRDLAENLSLNFSVRKNA